MRKKEKHRNINIPALSLLSEEETPEEITSLDTFKQEAIYKKINGNFDLENPAGRIVIDPTSNIESDKNRGIYEEEIQNLERADNSDSVGEDFIRLESEESANERFGVSNPDPIDDGRLPVTENEQLKQESIRKREMEDAFNDL